jgi:hypothetical protein
VKATITFETRRGKWVKRRVELEQGPPGESMRQRTERARAAYVKKYGEPKPMERIISIDC